MGLSSIRTGTLGQVSSGAERGKPRTLARSHGQVGSVEGVAATERNLGGRRERSGLAQGGGTLAWGDIRVGSHVECERAGDDEKERGHGCPRRRTPPAAWMRPRVRAWMRAPEGASFVERTGGAASRAPRRRWRSRSGLRGEHRPWMAGQSRRSRMRSTAAGRGGCCASPPLSEGQAARGVWGGSAFRVRVARETTGGCGLSSAATPLS